MFLHVRHKFQPIKFDAHQRYDSYQHNDAEDNWGAHMVGCAKIVNDAIKKGCGTMPYDYLPSHSEQANLRRNYWFGFWFIIVVGIVLYCLLMWILGLILKKNILGVIFGNDGEGSDKAVAIGVGGGSLGLLIAVIVYYIYRSGGSLQTASTDAHVLGFDHGHTLTGNDQAMRAQIPST